METKINELINEWQVKWSHLQDLISEQIKNKDYAGAYHNQCRATQLKSCIKALYSILNTSEKTEA